MIQSRGVLMVVTSLVLVGSDVSALPNPQNPPTSLDISNPWVSNGPDGGEVTSLRMDPRNPLILFAATHSGVYKTVDGGTTWTAVNSGLDSTDVRALTIDPGDSSRLYVSSSDGLYVSSNGGTDWILLATMNRPQSVFVSPSDSSVLYVASGSLIYRSVDRGSTWTRILQSRAWDFRGFSIPIALIALDPNHPSTLYASDVDTGNSTYGGGLYKSTDGGTTWNVSSARRMITCLTVDPFAPDTLYASVARHFDGSVLFDGGFSRSLDGGATWTDITRGGSRVYFSDLEFRSPSQGELYGVSGSALFRSVNGGLDWSEVSAGNRWGISSLVFDSVTPSTFYAASRAGALRSVDWGAHWAQVNPTLRDANIATVVVAPSQPDTIFAGTSEGDLFVTVDRGASWQLRGVIPFDAPNTRYALAVDPVSPSTLYAGGSNGVFKSTDGGAVWVPKPDGLSPVDGIQNLAIDPNNPSAILVATRRGGIYRSRDGGDSWDVAMTGLPYTTDTLPAHSYVWLASAPTTSGLYYLSLNYRFYETIDGGLHWTEAGVPPYASNESPFRIVAVAPTDPKIIYGMTSLGWSTNTSSGSYSQIYRSADGGRSWAFVFRQPSAPHNARYTSLVVHPLWPNVLYLMSDVGIVAISTDGGVTWQWIGAGLPSGPDTVPTSVAFSPTNPRTVYLGLSSGGVYRRDGLPVFAGPESGGGWAGTIGGQNLIYNGGTYPIVNGRVNLPDCTTFIVAPSGALMSRSTTPNCTPSSAVTPVISWANPAAVMQGTALSATQLNATSGGVAGLFVYNPPAGTTMTTAGNQTLSATFTPTDGATYSTVTTSVTLVVTASGAGGGGFVGPPNGGWSGTISGQNLIYNGGTYPIVNGRVSFPNCTTFIVAPNGALLGGSSTPNCTPGGGVGGGPTTPTLTWATPASVTVGTALSATQLNATSGGVAGTFAYNPPAGTTMTAAGNQTLSVTFTPTDASTYSTATTSVTLVVTASGGGGGGFVGPPNGGWSGTISGQNLIYNGGTYPIVNGRVNFPNCTTFIVAPNGALLGGSPTPNCTPGSGGGGSSGTFVGPANGGGWSGTVNGSNLLYNGGTYPIINGRVSFPDCTMYIVGPNGALMGRSIIPNCTPQDKRSNLPVGSS